jgi:hypothetical protein
MSQGRWHDRIKLFETYDCHIVRGVFFLEERNAVVLVVQTNVKKFW